jgi:hypothetical protein
VRRIGLKREQKSEYLTAAITVINLLDELDWVIGGYGNPTPQFLYSLNTFTETYVLTDELFVSFHDAMHLNLSSPMFPNGRPLLHLLAKDGLLRTIVEGEEHLKEDIGTVIYTFKLKEGETLDTNHEWMRVYKDNVDKKLLSQILPHFKIGVTPDTTPLLVLGGSKGSANHAIVLFNRDIRSLLSSILSLSKGSNFHIALPLYAIKAQADYFPRIAPSVELYRSIAKIHGVAVEKILEHSGYKEIPLPPLTSILLSRCKTRDDIPLQLEQLRSEFAGLREAGRLHEQRLINANTIREQFEVIEEFNEFWDTYSKKMHKKTTRIIYRLWDIVKEANPLSWVTKTLDELKVRDQEKVILNRYKGIHDIWRMSRDVPAVQHQLKDVERVFGVPIQGNLWQQYVAFAETVENIIFPQGRSVQK